MTIIARALLFALSGCTVLPAQADDGRSHIETLTVTATRLARSPSTLPNTITVLEREAVLEQAALAPDLSQILSQLVPSFSPPRQKLSGVGESFRGRNPLYLIDGIPQSTPLRDDGRDAHAIDPFLIERIEVVHGASALQGLGATGGIVNIITKKAAEDEGLIQGAQARVSLPDDGDRDGLGYKAGYYLGGKAGGFDLLVAGSQGAQGLFYDGHGDSVAPDPIQGDLEDAKDRNLFLKAGYEWGEQRLQFMTQDYRLKSRYRYTAQDGKHSQGLPAQAVERRPEGLPPELAVTTYGLDYRHGALAGGSLVLQLFRNEYEGLFGGGRLASFQDPRIAPNLLDQSQNVSDKEGAKLSWARDDLFVDGLATVVGIDFLTDTTYQALVHTGRLWVPETRYDNHAPFVQLEYAAGPLTLSGGARRENSRLAVDDFTTIYTAKSTFVRGGKPEFAEELYNAGAVYRISDAWRAFLSYSEGFGMPDVGRVLRAINKPGLSVDTFLDLQPIVTDNREAGFAYQGDALSARASYFQSESELGSRFLLESDGFYRISREGTEVKGWELELDWSLNAEHAFGLAAARVEGRYDANGDGSVDTRLSGIDIPPRRLSAYWQAELSPALSSRLQATQLFDRQLGSTAPGVYDFEGYTTADWLLTWRSGVGDFRFAVENLGDRFYISHYAQVAARDDQYFAGRGRSYSLSWTHDF